MGATLLRYATAWDKNIFCQCGLLYPMRSLSTEANHLGFTNPSSCLLLWCNYLLEAGWLRHNKNSRWLRQLVPDPGVAHFKASWRRKSIFWWTRSNS